MEDLLQELTKRQKRYSKSEKADFRKYLSDKLRSFGYDHEEIHNKLSGSRHLATISDKEADIIFLAHYDTATLLPAWVEGFFRLIGHTRNTILLVILILLFQSLTLIDNSMLETILRYILIASVMVPLLLIPNRHTMNDNTSGVLVLLQLAKAIADNNELRNRVKFVFTDNEEKMLIGTFQLKRFWKRKDKYNKKHRFISVDSVGRGDQVIISYNNKRQLADTLTPEFIEKGANAKSLNMYWFPFSDAWHFRDAGSVTINMMNRSIIPGGYYIKNIHTYRDKEINKENIILVSDSLESFIKKSQTDNHGRPR